MLSGWRRCFDVDTADVLRDNEAFKRADCALKGGKLVELGDVEAMWEACLPIFKNVLGEHRRPEEAKITTLVTRRYQAYAVLSSDD